MNNHMSLKLVGSSSSLELNSPTTSIYLQEELTGLSTLPAIRETKGMNIGMNGGWTSAQFYEPRLITIKGVIANKDVTVVEQRRKQLIQLLAEKRLALEFQTEAGNHYTMNVVVTGVQMPLSKVLTASYFQINLRADDPLIYDNNALAELEAILRRSSSASSGFTINFPINFQLGTSESRPTIDNFGSSVIYPTITLTGPLTTPEIVNITTNMAFTIDEVLGAGTYTASGIRGAMNQEGSIDTYSGNQIQTTRDAESPISKFSLYGDATQTTYSGKNLANLVPITNGTLTNSSYISTAETVYDSTLKKNVVHLVASGAYPTIKYTLPQRLESGKYYSLTVTYRSAHTGTGADSTKEMWFAPNWSSNNWDTLGSFANGNSKNQNGVSGAKWQPSTSWTTATMRFYVDPTQYATGNSPYSSINFSLAYGITSVTTAKEAWIADAMLAEITQAEWNATNYTDEDYEPYVGGTASPNPDYPQAVNTVTGEQVVKITGKNLSPVSQYSDIIWGENKVDYKDFLNTLGAGTYTFSAVFTITERQDTTDDSKYGIYFANSAGLNVLERPQWGAVGVGATATLTKTFTITEAQVGKFTNAYFYGCGGATGNPHSGKADITNIQVELGTATPYEPYQGQEYTIDLGSIELAKIPNTSYQDRIYKDGEKWYIEKQIGKVVLDGSETWTRTALTSGARFYTINNNLGLKNGNSDGTDIISDHFVGVDYSTYFNTGGINGVSYSYYNASHYIQAFSLDASFTSGADFKTWLTTHPTTVYYALATPTTTEITEQALIDQLDAILEAHLYEGLNNISNVAISPNLSGDLEIKTGQTLTVIDSLSIVGSSGTAEIDLSGSELAMVGSVADELTINGTTGAVTKTARIGKIASYAGETITTDYISTSGGLDSDATIYYVLPSSSTSVINTLDSTALAAFNGVVASGGVSAQTNIGSISVDVTTVTAQDVAVVDTKQHTVTINGVGAYSKFSGDWLTLDVGLNELQLITENNTDTGSAVIKYRVGYMGV